MVHLGLAMERKLYLDKLRAVEKYLKTKGAKDERDPFLKQVKQILYEESIDFKLTSENPDKSVT